MCLLGGVIAHLNRRCSDSLTKSTDRGCACVPLTPGADAFSPSLCNVGISWFL